MVTAIELDTKGNDWSTAQSAKANWGQVDTEQQIKNLGPWNDPNSTGNVTFGVWVVIFGSNLNNLTVKRYDSRTATTAGLQPDKKGDGFGGAGAKTPENAKTADGPNPIGVWVNSTGTIMIVADIPGRRNVPAGLYPISFHANYEVVATSKLDNTVQGRIYYDYNMDATAIGPNGVTENEAHTTSQTPGVRAN